MLTFAHKLLTARYRRTRQPSKLVAIVVPIRDSEFLTADEEISVRHLRHYLGAYDKFLIAPCGLKFDLPGFHTLYFHRRFFGSPKAHSWLLYRPEFYKKFEDYKYILMHHLDALVFADELKEWCETGVDYIGAPWMETGEPQVGNGGLALMNVASVLNVLYSRHSNQPAKFWQDRFPAAFKKIRSLLYYPWRLIPKRFRNSRIEKTRQTLRTVEVSGLANDRFWANQAVQYVPGFRIPDWKTGLRFAFEHRPWECFELNGRRLPFGCHAWPRYRSFWDPYLLKQSSRLTGEREI